MPHLLRRLAGALVLVWLVVTLTFVLVRAAPGDAAQLLVPPGASASDEEKLRAEFGLDAPVVVQYARWVGGALMGNFGESFSQRRPVRAVIADALPVSLGLGVASLALTYLLGVAIGLAQAARRGAVDTAITVATTAVYAAPSFWLGLAAIALATHGAATLGLPAALRLPAFGLRSAASDATGVDALVDLIRHAILPVAVLAAIGAAGVARYTRASAVALWSLDWVRTARAKGASRARVQWRHVLANALPPLVILFALALPGVVAGSVFVESVFAWPGMGRALVQAIAARDMPVVLGCTVAYAALVIVANLAVDLVLPRLDPRRR